MIYDHHLFLWNSTEPAKLQLLSRDDVIFSVCHGDFHTLRSVMKLDHNDHVIFFVCLDSHFWSRLLWLWTAD